MITGRAFFNRACFGLFDAVAVERSFSHREGKTARYVFVFQDGTCVGDMFEKNDGSPPNIWCHEGASGGMLIAALKPRRSHASGLWTERGKGGEPLYGRHSALEKMPQLGGADLVCFAPETLAEVGRIIDRLRGVTASDLSDGRTKP